MKAAALSLMTTLAMTLVLVSPASAEIAWQTNLRTAHAQAQAEGKLLLLHFFTDNCSWCDKLEAGAFKDSTVNNAIGQNFVAVKIHAGQSPKLAEMFKVTKFPTDVIVTVEGKTVSHGVSPQQPERYVAMLGSTLTNLPSRAIPGPASTPSAPMMANQPTTAPSKPAVASAPSPTVAQVAASQSGSGQSSSAAASWELPSSVGNAGTGAQLASSKTDGLSLTMPSQSTAPTTPTAKMAAPAVAAQTQLSAPTQSKPAATATKTTAGKVPAAPELAMDGYCAVSVIDDAKWVEGSPEFGVIHLGKLYLFASKSKMQKFLNEPIPYTPVLNEIDVVRFFEERVIVPGKREWAMQDPFNKRMFFFADEAAMLHFENSYERYVDAAINVMDKAVKESNPGT